MNIRDPEDGRLNDPSLQVEFVHSEDDNAANVVSRVGSSRASSSSPVPSFAISDAALLPSPPPSPIASLYGRTLSPSPATFAPSISLDKRSANEKKRESIGALYAHRVQVHKLEVLWNAVQFIAINNNSDNFKVYDELEQCLRVYLRTQDILTANIILKVERSLDSSDVDGVLFLAKARDNQLIVSLLDVVDDIRVFCHNPPVGIAVGRLSAKIRIMVHRVKEELS